MKIQTMILREIFIGKSNQTVEKIARSTGLTEMQVHNALKGLKNRQLIIKTKQSMNARYNVPPENKIYVNINEKVIPRIRRLIGNGL